MDKNAIKKYAVWARNELLERVSQRAMIYGITAKEAGDPNAESVNGHLLSQKEKRQRQALIRNIKAKGYEQVMEEVAYTWFNRFAALRFMEVNGYLPSHIRVFTNDAGEFKPQILSEAIHLDLDGLDMNRVYELESTNKSEELFKYLLIVQCNALNSILPGMFQKIDDYTELLLPDYLLREGSVIEQMISTIPEEDWTDQVQIIGWLYQYYITEPKDTRINARKQYIDSDIPFVTQLFTSDWIVRFMVENSLGRLWKENHNSSKLFDAWDYYVEESADKAESQDLDSSRFTDSVSSPIQIKCIDPCSGSGHIVVYAFDILVQIYQEYGFSQREAAEQIVKNNIYALDIDERAVQLTYFSIMMKARQYDRRFFTKKIQPNVYRITSSKGVSDISVSYFAGNDSEVRENVEKLLKAFECGNVYGSLIRPYGIDFGLLEKRLYEVEAQTDLFSIQAASELKPLIDAGKVLSGRYAAVITNPPYMATKYMPDRLREYVSIEYPDFKSDLFAAFIVRCSELCESYGHLGFLAPYVWMFIQSYEKLREYVYAHMTFSSLVQLEYNAFEAACVPVAAFTLRNFSCDCLFGCIKLSEFRGIDNQAPKTREAILNRNCGYRYSANQRDFQKIPGAPIAYWISGGIIKAFDKGISVDALSDFTGSQHITADNKTYLRLFWEVDFTKIGKGRKWAYYAKGGEYRKWYGNIQIVVDISDQAMNYYKECSTANCLKEKYWFQEGITYSAITSSGTGFRYYEPVGGFDKGGPTICYLKDLKYVLGILNSNMAEVVFQVMNPTINLQVKDIKALPILIDHDKQQVMNSLVSENIAISKKDWDSYETSYGFTKHPMITGDDIEAAFEMWRDEAHSRFTRLRDNEEAINALVNEIYDLQNDIPTFVDPAKVTVKEIDRESAIKSLISYAVGCMFGRYSLDREGIVCSNCDAHLLENNRYPADRDNIIPISDDEYFDDDIVGRFVLFIETVYGKEKLEKNLDFIAKSLHGNGTSREVIRQYFLQDFYGDHCATYAVTGMGKRPIYWLFDSGKKNGFKCLIYVHRYQPDTIARIRTDYVHEQQSRYRTAITDLEQRINGASTSERVKLNKKLAVLRAQAEEIRVYEEKIHHLADQMIKINLDDGILKNYELFKDVLAKIK